MNRIGVLHLTDTLDAGGAERVAVNIVNHLPRERFSPHLCTTRREGPLADLVAADVGRLRLNRQRRFDVGALQRLVAFIRDHDLHILHAHGASLFTAVLAAFLPPHPVVIWHVHFPKYASDDRPILLNRLLARRVGGVIAASRPLAEWCWSRQRVPTDRVWYLPNFVCPAEDDGQPDTLPGPRGERIVCIANFRSQKDHLTLVHAMARVVQRAPAAHLLLVGAPSDRAYMNRVVTEITRQGLDRHVSLLGQRTDVPSILKACEVGVLSSASEGFPLALLEYGMAGLPSVATSAGQCSEILDDGGAGILVPPRSPHRLAEALLKLIQSPARRTALGEQLRRRVQEKYCPDAVMEKICLVYEHVLGTTEGRKSSKGRSPRQPDWIREGG